MINISTLPMPTVFYEINYENELSILEAKFSELNPDYAGLIVESDPVKKLLETAAYQTVLLKSEANEKLKQTMLAFASGNNLDNIAANTVTPRLLIKAGDPNAIPPTFDVWESDEDLRDRAQNAPEKWTTAGPKAAYEELAREIDGRIQQCVAQNHVPKAGDVTLSILTKDNAGEADEALIIKVENYFDDEDVVPFLDTIYVEKAQFIDTSIEVTVKFYKGQDKERVMTDVKAQIEALAKANFKFGEELTVSAINKASRTAGIQNVIVNQPTADIQPKVNEVVRVINIVVNDGGEYEGS